MCIRDRAYTYDDKQGLQRFPDKPIVEGTFSYTADYPYHGPRKLFSGGGGLTSKMCIRDSGRYATMR